MVNGLKIIKLRNLIIICVRMKIMKDTEYSIFHEQNDNLTTFKYIYQKNYKI